MSDDLSPQDAPSDVTCPYCGGEPEYDPEHQLSSIGYTHDDVELTCADCGETWTHGIPIGDQEDSPFAEELFCSACEERYGRVHRVHPYHTDETVTVINFHMKCPNCYHFWEFERDVPHSHKVLVGYPDIIGDVDEASEAEGYTDDQVRN